MRALTLVLVMVLGCGTVTADPKDGTAGAAGQLTAAGGRGGHGSGGELAGQGGQAHDAGAGGAPATCPDFADAAFGYGPPCDGGITQTMSGELVWLEACRATCNLNNKQFVGCVNDPRVPTGQVECRSSCSDCR